MQRVLEVLSASPPVGVSLVWVRVLAEDDDQAAQTAAGQFQHPGWQNFYDPGQLAAREMAAALGGAGSFAWDVYLAFSTGITWDAVPPKPSGWVHQLDHAAWASAERCFKGEALIQAIYQMVNQAMKNTIQE